MEETVSNIVLGGGWRRMPGVEDVTDTTTINPDGPPDGVPEV